MSVARTLVARKIRRGCKVACDAIKSIPPRLGLFIANVRDRGGNVDIVEICKGMLARLSNLLRPAVAYHQKIRALVMRFCKLAYLMYRAAYRVYLIATISGNSYGLSQAAASVSLAYMVLRLLILYLIVRVFLTRITEWLGWVWSVTLKALASKVYTRNDTIRAAFENTSFTEQKVASFHTHGHAAAERSSVTNFCTRLGAVLGLTPVFWQMSASDQRDGHRGTRTYYWAKDVLVEPRSPTSVPNSMMVLVDVDHYIDMPEFLVRNFGPTVVYTFQPCGVAAVKPEYSYTFCADGRIDYRVSGGAPYKHTVWKYGLDCLTATVQVHGLVIGMAIYIINRRSIMPDHEVILLSPVAKWIGIRATLAYYSLSGQVLERLNPVVGQFLRMHIMDPVKGLMVATGKVGEYNTAVIQADVDSALASLVQTSSSQLIAPQIFSFVEGNRIMAGILTEFFRTKLPSKPPIVYPVVSSIRRYQFCPTSFKADAKTMMVPFMSAIINSAMVPDRTVDNERSGIKGRIIKVRQNELPITKFLATCMTEFIELLIPNSDAWTLDPVDDDVVLMRQHRPQQHNLLKQNELALPIRKFTTFVKAESHQGPKEPRLITKINSVDKREYSKVLYALEVVLKRQKWYAFSRTPLDISLRVVEVLKEAKTAVNTDYSRFDGHGSNVMRELEAMLLARAFRTTHTLNVLELHKTQFNLKATATFGSEYVSGMARASGSPETSLFNSLTNAFIAYYAFRQTTVDGVFLGPREAFDRLGIYGGDDGLTADMGVNDYTRAAQSMGQQLVATPIVRGALGVRLLARVYGPDVWYGDPNNCCDLPRQLGKFHLTVHLGDGTTPLQKLTEKVRSFALTDLNTPIIGKYLQVALTFLDIKQDVPGIDRVTPWFARYPSDVQYPNHLAAWMWQYVQQELPNFDIELFDAWLSRVNKPEDLLAPPLCVDMVLPEVKEPVVVDDVVLPLGVRLPHHTTPVSIEGKHDLEADDDVKSNVPVPTPQPQRARHVTFAHGPHDTKHSDALEHRNNYHAQGDERQEAPWYDTWRAKKQRRGTWQQVKPIKPQRGRGSWRGGHQRGAHHSS